MYQYKAIVERVVDGDTVVLNIDLGFTVHWKSSCRLWGINTPELNSKDQAERLKALEAKDFVATNLPVGSEVIIHSKQLDKFGRPLVEIHTRGMVINNELVANGLAKDYLK